MKNVRLYPYNMHSEGATNLCNALDIWKIKREKSKYVPKRNDVIINWGNGDLPANFGVCKVINSPESVNKARCKKRFFEAMFQFNRDEGQTVVNIPDFTVNKEEALGWLKEGATVFSRSSTTGTGGAGITILEKPEDLTDAVHRQTKLYVKYVHKVREYRVHVFNGEVIDIQRKVKRADLPADEMNWKIRNHENGFVFARGAVENVPQHELVCIKAQATAACKVIGLDFGGVDVIYNEKRGRAYVIEVNTAPGIEGQTVVSYAEAFRKMLG